MRNYLTEAYKRYLTEGIEPNDISDIIDNHKRILVWYKSDGKDKHMGTRLIEVYAYGNSTLGNPVLRVFQCWGDSTRPEKVPGWKFLRLDRIVRWKSTGQTFDTPPEKRYKGVEPFNPNDDLTMADVYLLAKFDNKAPSYKDKFINLQRQLDNPIYLSDLKTKNGFVGAKEQIYQNGPVSGDDFNKSSEELEQARHKYDNDISSKFDSYDNIAKRLGIKPQPNGEYSDEDLKRIQMERDWAAVEKATARKKDKYQSEKDSYVLNKQIEDSDGTTSMNKLKQLANLKRRPKDGSDIQY